MANVKLRQELERKIARAFIKQALADNNTITVNDGGEDVLRCSSDLLAILKAMFSTDEDYLVIHHAGETATYYGWVRFVYGNDGYDVISDYTTNLEHLMTEANKISDRYA